MCTVDSVNAQLFGFNCKNDELNEKTVRLPAEVSSLILGQRCEVTVFNAKGRSIPGNSFTLSSSNEHVKSKASTFWVEESAIGSPWMYINTGLIEIEGNITIAANRCNKEYSFPFKVKQAYTFSESNIICKGERKEFAIARYDNTLGLDLFVVMDITRNQVHLLKAPISIDASGVKGKDGTPGTPGRAGENGTERNQDAKDGGDGGNGGDGGTGGTGGNITVYLPPNIPGISINVDGGEGGEAGPAGKGGKGGTGYTKKVTIIGDDGKQKIEDQRLGNNGRDGKDGLPGNPGSRGADGTINQVKVDNIKKYFEFVRQANFNINNIML